ncbi:MAG: hypothetical protein FJ257_09690 [Phycisphaerae bacterium]|nr:hypothetical protein [Phycisphaerae bacterium]
MLVHTVRFGSVEVESSRVLEFPMGLPGFARIRRLAILWAESREVFWWLQAIDDPAVSFLVTDPALWVPDYEVTIRPEDSIVLGLDRSEDASVLALVSRHGDRLTANLRSPLVVNASTRRGVQVVSAESCWSLRHEIASIESPALAGVL